MHARSLARGALLLGLLLGLLAVAGAAGCGARQARVWTTAQQVLPKGINRVVYVNLAALRQSEATTWLLAQVGRRLGLVADPVGEVRRACGIDLTSAEAVFAGRGYRVGVVFVRLPGVDRAMFLACLSDHFGMTAADDGARTLLTDRASGAQLAYLAWPRRDVFAMALDQLDVRVLEELTSGNGALAGDVELAAALVDVDDDAAIWGVVLPGSGDTEHAVAFNVRLGGGAGAAVNADVHLRVGSWAKAYLMARMVRRRLDRWAEDVQAISVDSEGQQVVFRVYLSSAQMKKALRELIPE